jgi:hypothetical protein
MTVSTGAAMVAMVGGSASPALIWAGPAMIPVAAGVTIYRNVSSRNRIEEIFTNRRLTLPLTLAPGQEITGSLFFPVTPGPRRLQFQLESQSLLEAMELHLPGLAMLHLGPSPADDAIPLRPVLRNGRYWLTIKANTVAASGYISINAQGRRFAPAEFEVEVDATGRLLETLNVSGSAPPSGFVPGIVSTTRTYQAGQIPPARILFGRGFVQEIPFGPPAAIPAASSGTEN